MRAAAAALALLTAACSQADPTIIDGSSPEAFQRTAELARREVPAADRLVFDRAINAFRGRRFAAEDPQALVRVTFDGMTGAQVVDDQRRREQ